MTSNASLEPLIPGLVLSLSSPWRACSLCGAETTFACPCCGRALCRDHLGHESPRRCCRPSPISAPPPAPVRVESWAGRQVVRRTLALAGLCAVLANLSLLGTLRVAGGMAHVGGASLGLVALQLTAAIFLIVPGVAGVLAVGRRRVDSTRRSEHAQAR